jgi:hypothetical protein
VLDLGPFLRRPISTLALLSDPAEPWTRFWENAQFTMKGIRRQTSTSPKKTGKPRTLANSHRNGPVPWPAAPDTQDQPLRSDVRRFNKRGMFGIVLK